MVDLSTGVLENINRKWYSGKHIRVIRVVGRNCIKYEYWKCTYLWTKNWSVAMKLPDPRAFWPVKMMVVVVVVAPFFAAIDATSGRSKPSSSPGKLVHLCTDPHPLNHHSISHAIMICYLHNSLSFLPHTMDACITYTFACTCMHAALWKIGRNTLAKNHSLVRQESMSE
jgi:hypothetical protein